MAEDKEKRLNCSECGARGVGEDGLCTGCRIGQEHGPEARQRYFQDLARKGGEATKRKLGRHRLAVEDLPALEGHADVKSWLSSLASAVAAGELSKKLSAELRQILRTWMKAHRHQSTDQVIEEIRTELNELRQKLEAQGEPWK